MDTTKPSIGAEGIPQAETTLGSDILTEEQASALLGVRGHTLRDWRHKRGLPHIRITSKVVRYRRTDIDDWLDRQRTVIG